jgi:hypothetical protein
MAPSLVLLKRTGPNGQSRDAILAPNLCGWRGDSPYSVDVCRRLDRANALYPVAPENTTAPNGLAYGFGPLAILRLVVRNTRSE